MCHPGVDPRTRRRRERRPPVAAKRGSGIPQCKPCGQPMAPHRTTVISGSGQRPRMMLCQYRCENCHSKKSIEREEYDLLGPEDSVWKDRPK